MQSGDTGWESSYDMREVDVETSHWTKLINGLIPHFVKDVSVDGTIKWFAEKKLQRCLASMKVPEFVGSVFQNPRTQFFHTNSNAEMAFGLENRGVET